MGWLRGLVDDLGMQEESEYCLCAVEFVKLVMDIW